MMATLTVEFQQIFSQHCKDNSNNQVKFNHNKRHVSICPHEHFLKTIYLTQNLVR